MGHNNRITTRANEREEAETEFMENMEGNMEGNEGYRRGFGFRSEQKREMIYSAGAGAGGEDSSFEHHSSRVGRSGKQISSIRLCES